MDGFGLENTSKGKSDQYLFVWNNYYVVRIQTVLVLFLQVQAQSEGLMVPGTGLDRKGFTVEVKMGFPGNGSGEAPKGVQAFCQR